MRVIVVAAIVLTALFVQALDPGVVDAAPSWMPLAVFGIIMGVLLWLRSRLGSVSPGTMAGESDGSRLSVGCHEYAHGLAVKRGGGKVKRMKANSEGGHTQYDLGSMREGSPEHLRAIAAGREAQVVYLTRNGYSHREAELAVTSHDDDVLLRSCAGSGGVSRARRDARRFVRQHYGKIERGGRKLARKGTMTDV